MILPYFLDDFLLFISLPILLSLNFFFTAKLEKLEGPSDIAQADDNDINEITEKDIMNFHMKKSFFFHLRFAQLVLVIIFLISVVNSYIYLSDTTIIDQLTLHYGNFFFRKDKIMIVASTLLTLVGLYYLYLLSFLFTRTRLTTKYNIELPFLLLTSLTSLRLFLFTNDLMLLTLLVEISAFCSVILIGIQSLSSTTILFPIEAAIKYFIINALAVSLLLGSIVLYFSLTNSVNIFNIGLFFQQNPSLLVFSFEQGLVVQVLFFFSYFIKIGVAPVHQWVPDVYEGAETIITAFLVLVVSPVLVFKLILLFKQLITNMLYYPLLTSMFKLFGMTSVIIGTLNGFYQTKIKRFIAYAGLTHLGFILLALAANDIFGYFSALAYLLIYYVTNIGFFTLLLLAQYRLQSVHNTLIYIVQLKNIFQSSSFFFFCFAVIFFSFAGIPPFAGFFIKFFVLISLLNHMDIIFLLLAIVCILIGSFMYLRFLKISLFEQTNTKIRYIKLFQSQLVNFYMVKAIPTLFGERKQQILPWGETLLLNGTIFVCLFLLGFIFFLPFMGLTLQQGAVLVLSIY